MNLKRWWRPHHFKLVLFIWSSFVLSLCPPFLLAPLFFLNIVKCFLNGVIVCFYNIRFFVSLCWWRHRGAITWSDSVARLVGQLDDSVKMTSKWRRGHFATLRRVSDASTFPRRLFVCRLLLAFGRRVKRGGWMEEKGVEVNIIWPLFPLAGFNVTFFMLRSAPISCAIPGKILWCLASIEVTGYAA